MLNERYGGELSEIKGTRLGWADAARAIAIALVVVEHSSDWLIEVGVAAVWWDDFKYIFESMRMPLLFTISGMFAAKWMYRPWREVLGVKVLAIAWLFILWSAIGSLVQMLGFAIQGGEPSPAKAAFAFAASPVRPLFELWFIWALAIFFVAARLLVRMPVSAQIAVTAGLCVAGYAVATPNLGWSGAMRYLVFFLVGIYARSRIIELQKKLTPAVGIAIFAAWAAASVAVWMFANRSVLLAVLAPVGVVAGIVLATWLQNVPGIQRLGQNTLPVYVTHVPVVVITAWLLHLFVDDAPAPVEWVSPVLLAALAMCIALIASRAVASTPLYVLYDTPRSLTRLGRRVPASAR